MRKIQYIDQLEEEALNIFCISRRSNEMKAEFERPVDPVVYSLLLLLL